MALDCIVVCRSVPRFHGEHELGPVWVSPPEWIAPGTNEQDDPRSLIPSDDVGSWMVTLTSDVAVPELVNELARTIAEYSGGGWIVADDEVEPVDAVDGASSNLLALLYDCMEASLEAMSAQSQAELSRAKVAWLQDRVNDPYAAADDDWSSV